MERTGSDHAAVQKMLSALREANMHMTGLRKEIASTAGHPRDASLYQIVLLCEASLHVSDKVAQAHPQLPWREMRELRRRLVHGCNDETYDMVWDLISDENAERILQELMKTLETLEGSATNSPA